MINIIITIAVIVIGFYLVFAYYYYKNKANKSLTKLHEEAKYAIMISELNYLIKENNKYDFQRKLSLKVNLLYYRNMEYILNKIEKIGDLK